MPSGTIYDNEVIEEYVGEVLFTKIRNSSRCNLDTSLTARPGETVSIFRYSGTGSAEVVSEGSGNTEWSDIQGKNYDYTVHTTQDRCRVTDEEIARNPLASDFKLSVIAGHLVNALDKDIFDEWLKGSQVITPAAATGVLTLPEFMSAFGQLDVGLDGGYNGQDESVACHMTSQMWLEFQKGLLNNTLVEYDVVNGELVPKINGRQIIVSDILVEYAKYFAAENARKKGYDTTKSAYKELVADAVAAANKIVVFETDQAVRLINGKKVSAESERQANERTTAYYCRDNYVAALEWDSKVAHTSKDAFDAAIAAILAYTE